MLSFIKNATLQKTIKDSIEFMNLIFTEAEESKSNLYKEEMYRVIILYVVAVIEAILLYVIKERGDQITSLIYKDPSEISSKIKHLDYPNEKLVTAIQTRKVKSEKEVGVQDLVSFMKRNKLMSEKFAEEVLEINNIRNTFHFTKSRDGVEVELERVEKAFELLHKTIKGAPKAIHKKS